MVTICGVEADYDAERMSFDDAVDLLAQKGITAIVYTSPWHAEDRQRWRVLCPLSQEMPPGRRDHFLGRLNGLLRGIFAGESWTLSQAYYYGSVNRNPSHRVEVIDGHAIDAHDDLDMIWLGESAGPAQAAANGNASQDTRHDAELIRCIVTCEHLHVELVALSERYVARGIPSRVIADLLRGMMLSHPEASRDERWLDRYQDIGRTVARIPETRLIRLCAVTRGATVFQRNRRT